MGNLRSVLKTWRDDGRHRVLIDNAVAVRQRYRRTMQTLLSRRIIKSIRNTGVPKDLDKIFDLASRGFYGIISPIQSRYEFTSLLGILQQNPPKTILEIGTARGGTLFMLTRVATEDATIVSLDLPQGPFGGGYDEFKIPLYSSFARPKQKLHLLRADSHTDASLQAVTERFGGRTIDFLFIDGDHTYEGVRHDFEMYSPLVTNGGYVAFHDTVYAEGVKKFWTEVKPRYVAEEWVDPCPTRYGIGLVKLGLK